MITDSCCLPWNDGKSTAISDYGTLCIESGGSRLYGSIMWPDGGYARPRPCLVLLHGYPGSLPNGDLMHVLCSQGFVVVQPNHRGAWGSEGNYLLSNCIEDAVNIVNKVRGDDFVRAYNIDPGKVFLLGHSMGSCTAVNAARRLPFLRGLVLMTPFDPYRLMTDERRARLFLSEGEMLRTESPGSVYEDLAEHAQEYSFNASFPFIKDQNLFFALGLEDNLAPPDVMTGEIRDMLRANGSKAIQRFIAYPAGHGLLGSRDAFIRDMLQFLQDTLTGNYGNRG